MTFIKNPPSSRWASIKFDVPLVDWGRRKSQMRTAYANKKIARYSLRKTSDLRAGDSPKVRTFETLAANEITQKIGSGCAGALQGLPKPIPYWLN